MTVILASCIAPDHVYAWKSTPGDHLALHCGSILRVRGPRRGTRIEAPCRISPTCARRSGPYWRHQCFRRSGCGASRVTEPIPPPDPAVGEFVGPGCSRKRPGMLRTRVLAHTGYLRTDRADSAHRDVHRHPCHGGAVQGVDDLLVDDPELHLANRTRAGRPASWTASHLCARAGTNRVRATGRRWPRCVKYE